VTYAVANILGKDVSIYLDEERYLKDLEKTATIDVINAEPKSFSPINISDIFEKIKSYVFFAHVAADSRYHADRTQSSPYIEKCLHEDLEVLHENKQEIAAGIQNLYRINSDPYQIMTLRGAVDTYAANHGTVETCLEVNETFFVYIQSLKDQAIPLLSVLKERES
jgi:hypothetical protein